MTDFSDGYISKCPHGVRFVPCDGGPNCDRCLEIERFEKWYQELCDLARKEQLLWMISNDPEDHRDGYEDGNTPEMELEEQISAAI